MNEHTAEKDAREEREFFSLYAQNYTDPERIWLARIIQRAGPMAGSDSIARVVLDAGYVRSANVIPPGSTEGVSS